MKAAQINAYGSANELFVGELAVPEIAKDEVLVKAKATSINPIDWKAREGLMKQMFDWQFPVVLGWDVAGIITEVGSDVKDFKVGDAVFARPDIYQDGRRGTYAQYVAVKEDKLALKPENVSFVDAASIPLAGLTALQMLNKLEVSAGKKILIQGGAGGVGMFAIQLAKLMGAYVATTASAHNHDFVTSLGADLVIDYHENKIEDVLADYDAVFDTVGDIDGGLAILKADGKFVTITKQPTEAQLAATQTVIYGWLQPNGKELAYLGELMSNGQLKTVIDSTFELTTEGIQAAHRKSESHHARGKIILTID